MICPIKAPRKKRKNISSPQSPLSLECRRAIFYDGQSYKNLPDPPWWEARVAELVRRQSAGIPLFRDPLPGDEISMD